MNIEENKKITLSLIDTFNKASQMALDLRKIGLTKEIKSDNTPVSNGDIEVNRILTNKIFEITPNIPIVSEESADHKDAISLNNFWLIDPIDGTKDYINNRDEFTLNAALILNKKPVIGIITAPAKKRIFYSYGISNSYELVNNQEISLINKEKDYKELTAVSYSNDLKPEILALSINLIALDSLPLWLIPISAIVRSCLKLDLNNLSIFVIYFFCWVTINLTVVL